MIQWIRSKTPHILCVVLALGCGGKAETQASPSVAGSAASLGSSGSPTGGQSGAGGASAEAGGVVGTDACQGKVCNTPPSNACPSGTEFLSYDRTGSCSEGVCSYVSHQTACTCQNGACTTDPCIAVTCASPLAASCTGADGNTQTTYSASGTCSAGSCSYAPTNKTCPFGCANGACKPDPCAAVVCNAPTAAICKTSSMATTYATTGTCTAGTCSYASTDKGCGANNACTGAGVCSECIADTSCGAQCLACGAGTPKCKDLGGTSQCVACLSDADCSGTAPFCDTTTNACVAARSCIGLAATCGSSGGTSCCASSVVTGVTTASFYRSYDGVTSGYTSQAYPAQVNDFRLDTYEITVGRFRKFWNGYPGNMPTGGSGKNPNNSSDPGWDATWNTSSLPASQAALTTNISCNSTYQTWAAGNDALPMNCLDWFEAEALCIWDGGRLPTEAEWNYAAAGGTAQRAYPWGSAALDCSYANSTGCVGAANRVGSESPKGDGLYGQADLAGNVWEWVQDWYTSPYTNPCNNCSHTTDTTASFDRVVQGGSFSGSASYLLSSYRGFDTPSDRGVNIGGRCARTR